MTLLELIKAVEGVAKMQPAVKMIVPEDIFRLSNEMSAKYGVFAWTQGAHSVDVGSGMAVYTLTLFYVDRLLEDKSNAVEIHSVGVETLANIVRGVVETGDVFSVSGTNGSGRQVVTTEEDGILKIREEKERGGFWKQVSFRLGSDGFGFGTFENGTELIVTVPEGAELEEAKASLGAGEMRLDGLKVSRKTEIETGAGTAVLTNFAGNGETDLSCGTGELEVTGFLNGEISVSCGTGSVLLMLGEEEKDYSFRVSCGIGEVRVGDRSYSNLGSEVKSLLPGAANELDISCGIGQVTVVFTGNEVSEIRE